MSSTEPNKYEERQAVPSTSMYPGRWTLAWWTRRALLDNDGWFNYVKGHNPYNYFGIYDVVRFDTFWLDK